MATQIVQNRAGAVRPTSPLPAAAVQAMHRIEHALAAPERELAAKVGKALGLYNGWRPRTDLGETVTDFSVWSQVELNTLFERVGGTVTTGRVERHTTGCNPWMATELRLTVDVPGVGPVQIWTELDDESEAYPLYPTDLPVIHAARAVTV